MSASPPLTQRLWYALSPSLQPQIQTLRRVRRKGTSHDHIRLIGSGLIARIPRRCPDHQTPEQALTDQATRFRYGRESHHTPDLHTVLIPSSTLPFGALLISDVPGRLPRTFKDLRSIAKSLASIHALGGDSPPAGDPLSSILSLITQRWSHILGFSQESICLLRDELQQTTELFSTLMNRHPIPTCLIGNDTHPGNFLIDPQGKGLVRRLRKSRFQSPCDRSGPYNPVYLDRLVDRLSLFSKPDRSVLSDLAGRGTGLFGPSNPSLVSGYPTSDLAANPFLDGSVDPHRRSLGLSEASSKPPQAVYSRFLRAGHHP